MQNSHNLSWPKKPALVFGFYGIWNKGNQVLHLFGHELGPLKADYN